jgi:hypothetical protein
VIIGDGSMKDTLVVKGLDGNDITLFVIDIIEDTMTNKQYMYYTIDGNDDVFVSGLVENNGTYSLEQVSEEEKNILIEALKDGRN